MLQARLGSGTFGIPNGLIGVKLMVDRKSKKSPRMGRPPKPGGRAPAFSLRISAEALAALNKRARKEGKTRSKLACELLEAAVGSKPC